MKYLIVTSFFFFIESRPIQESHSFKWSEHISSSCMMTTISTNHYICGSHGCLYPEHQNITCTNVSFEQPYDYQDFNTNEYNNEDNYYNIFSITLKILQSNISTLPTSAFIEIPPKIIELNLENNELETIIPGAFNNQPKIQKMLLGRNKLLVINSGIFNFLTVLNHLDLSNNNIETITDHAFRGTQLTNLNITHNNIKQFFKTLFESLSKNIILDLSFNQIKELDVDIKRSVDTLLLNNNKISRIIHFPQTLKKIDLSNNEIEELANFSTSNVSEVVLRNNKIKSIEKNIFVEKLDISNNLIKDLKKNILGHKLTVLNVSHNLISSINVDTFNELKNLEKLSLSDNQLSVIPNACFKENNLLTHLDLSSNNLSQFSYGTFDHLEHLKFLNISFNKFNDLPQYELHSLTNLEQFYFENNNIDYINTDDLIKNMPKLKNISLGDNAWLCKDLQNILHELKKYNITFSKKETSETSHVYGIKCQDKISVTKPTDVSNSNIKANDDNFYKTAMYRYFNKEFENSNFFRFLESLNTTHNILRNNKQENNNLSRNNEYVISKILENSNKTLEFLNKTDIILNDLNSIFNKQIEILNNNTINQLQRVSQLSQEINKNSQKLFDTFLIKLKSANNSSIDFSPFVLNKLEVLNLTNEKQELMSNHLYEKLIQENTADNTNLLQKSYAIEIFNLLFVIIGIVLLALITYINIARFKYLKISKNEIELNQLLEPK